jgi:hypothetical protein
VTLGVIGIPPVEEDQRMIDRNAKHFPDGRTQLRLKPQTPRRPLRRGPDEQERDQKDEEYLAPEDAGGGHNEA